MEKTLIILAALGEMKAYEVLPGSEADEITPRLEQILGVESLDAHRKLSDKLSDAGGRFAEETSIGKMKRSGSGERHGIVTEARRRLIKEIAGNIEGILSNSARGNGNKSKPKDVYGRWHFAAHESINERILDILKPETAKKLEMNIKADLVKLSKSKLIEKFALA